MYSAGNEQKTPFGRSLNDWGRKKIQGAMEMAGWSLPASIVALPFPGFATVKFEVTNCPYTLPQVTVPIVGSIFHRVPYQIGTLGLVQPCDASLTGVAGQTNGAVDFAIPQGPLSSLAWQPIGNKNWQAVDPNVHYILGPNGAVVSTVAGDSFMRVQPGKVTISAPIIEIDGAIQSSGPYLDIGSLSIRTMGDVQARTVSATSVVASGIQLENHVHGGVTTGSGSTGTPTP